MSEAAAEAEEPPKKKSKPLLLALVGALALGGGSFYGVYSGLIPLPFGGDPQGGEEDGAHAVDDSKGKTKAKHDQMALPAFVPVETLLVSLAPDANAKHLKISLQIEADPAQAAILAELQPRIVDVLNTFLRAVDTETFEQPRSMARLRAQMLRRVQLVSPPGSVRDVLIQEFVLN